MNCDFNLQDGVITCQRCGFSLPWTLGDRFAIPLKQCGWPVYQSAKAAERSGYPCIYRGELLRTQIADTCGYRGQTVEIRRCEHFGDECAVKRLCKKTPGDRFCNECSVRVEPARIPTKIEFKHGLGDAVLFVPVLRHLAKLRPDLQVSVACNRRDAAILAQYASVEPTGEETISHSQIFPDTNRVYGDLRTTMPGRTLWESYGIQPDPALMSLECRPTEGQTAKALDWHAAQGSRPFVLIQWHGDSQPAKKNLPLSVVQDLIERITHRGWLPVVVDFTHKSDGFRCPVLGRGSLIHGDPLQLAAIAQLSMECIGIDSGPSHVMQASGAKCRIIWTGHHPAKVCPPMANVTHYLPADADELLTPGETLLAAAWFRAEYRHERYAKIEDLPRVLYGTPTKRSRKEITVRVPQGIGDCWWIHQQLQPHFKRINYRVLTTPGHRHWIQRRMQGWTATWPNAGDVDFEQVSDQEYHRVCNSPWTVAGLLARYDAGETVQDFANIGMLEAGVPLDEIDPELPVVWKLPLVVEPSNRSQPYVAVYVCGDTRHAKQVWRIEQWAELVRLVVPKAMPIVLLGAPYDGDMLAALECLLTPSGYQIDLRCQTTPAEALGLLRDCAAFISYQSGLAVLAEQFQRPQIKLWFADAIRHRVKWTWVAPERRHDPLLVFEHFSSTPSDVASKSQAVIQYLSQMVEGEQ